MGTHGSSVGFRTGAGGAVGVNVSGVHSAFGGGREDVVRYDSPGFGPFCASVAVGDNGMWDFGVTVAGKFSGMEYDVRGGYHDDEHSAGTDQ